MKTLMLLRHAKSSWKDTALADIDRPLATRGKRDARRMGRHLARHFACPALIMTSPAQRARATARRVALPLRYKKRAIVVDARLYPGRIDTLLQLIAALDDRHRHVMLVGHDPALLRLAQRLSRSIAHLPTASVASFTFDTEAWRTADKTTLRSVSFEAFR